MTKEDAGWLAEWKENGVGMRCQEPSAEKVIHLEMSKKEIQWPPR